MSFKKPVPSDGPYGIRRAKQFRLAKGVHAFDTEARTLEQACDMIAAQQRAAQQGKTRRETPLSLKQQYAAATGRAVLLKMHGKISLAPVCGTPGHSKKTTPSARKIPPPMLHMMSRADKRAKARLMFSTGQWGIGDHARQELAKAFGVTFFDMYVWLRDMADRP